jgi:serine phosphatase RsbU (regulator of sigma subunit)/tetratricopeptide (TPR) repeat protein
LKIYLKKIGLFILLAIASSNFIYSQNFADKTFYLIDSLVIEDVSAQDRQLIDSVLTLYHEEKLDTIKLQLISEIVETSWDDNVWPKYNQLLYDNTQKLLSNPVLNSNEKVVIKKIAASAVNNIGYLHSSRGEFELAIKYYFKSLQIQKSLKNERDVAVIYNNIGRVYDQQGQSQMALKSYFNALKIQEQLKDKRNIAVTANNIGLIYINQADYELALEYLNKSLTTHKELNNQSGIALAYNNIGFLYSKKKDYTETLKYYKLCLAMRTEANDVKLLAYSLNNIGYVYAILNNVDSAFVYYNKSLEVLERINDSYGLVFAYTGLGKINLGLGNVALAKKYAKKSFIISDRIGSPERIMNSASLLSEVYEREHKYDKALKYHKLLTSIKDSLSTESIRKKNLKQAFEYQYEKKSLADSLSRMESQKIKDLKYNQEIEKQKSYTYGGLIGLFLMSLVIIAVFRGYRLKKRSNLELASKNEVIEEKSREISDSINYAKRIQNAIIPSDSELEHHLKKGFVMFRPKDVVAGDFYWLEQVGDEVLYAAADCTGHGVPGAMVSVVCHNALNRSVREYSLTEPAAILDKTRELVIETFQRSREDSSIIRDGMDIALCAINYKTNTLQYSGANNSLYVIRNGELMETKPDKQPVGKHFKQTSFTNHIVKLEEADAIFTFSDGYADQFGGEKGKKFMYKQFKKLLISISNKTITEQKEILIAEFDNWKGDLDQIDDVCIIGVKV